MNRNDSADSIQLKLEKQKTLRLIVFTVLVLALGGLAAVVILASQKGQVVNNDQQAEAVKGVSVKSVAADETWGTPKDTTKTPTPVPTPAPAPAPAPPPVVVVVNPLCTDSKIAQYRANINQANSYIAQINGWQADDVAKAKQSVCDYIYSGSTCATIWGNDGLGLANCLIDQGNRRLSCYTQQENIEKDPNSYYNKQIATYQQTIQNNNISLANCGAG